MDSAAAPSIEDQRHPEPPDPAAIWADAALCAALLAVDAAGLGGAVVPSWPGPVRRHWLETLSALLPESTPWRPLPAQVTQGRLLGGLDLAATLETGRPVVARGVLADADGGVVLAQMAERLPQETAAQIALTMDNGQVVLERDGLARRDPARFGVVALDESDTDEEGVAPALVDRLALRVRLEGLRHDDAMPPLFDAADIVRARTALPHVTVSDAVVDGLCRTAMALGVGSVRADLAAVRVACCLAALDGRGAVGDGDAILAARLVLSHRATQLPAPPAEEETPPPPENADPSDETADAPPAEAEDGETEPPPQPEDGQADAAQDPSGGADGETFTEAARAAIPQGLLNRLVAGQGGKAAARGSGKQGAVGGARRGRPIGVRRGTPGGGDRLNVIETLRAAAPWQTLRRGALPPGSRDLSAGRLEIRADDFRITRFKQRAESTTIFVVDASGSAALTRLAEAKGAVELLLADCYVRRDEVALIAFRGKGADVLLPPTRSSARAKRSLSALPGGGGTPLAAGLEAARVLAESERRRGRRPAVVILSDGGANIDRDGQPGRDKAKSDALAAAEGLARAGVGALFVDTSQRGQARGRAVAQAVARAMRADYLALPQADASALSTAVKARAPASPGAA